MVPKKWLLLLKIGMIVIACYIIAIKTDFRKIFIYIYQAHLIFLLLACLALYAAQYICAYRTKHYLQTASMHLSGHKSIALYFTGMFFNVLLPGGIGGDGYKLYYLGKRNTTSKLTILRCLLSDRCNGLYVLLIYILCLVLVVDPSFYPKSPVSIPIIAAVAMLGVTVIYWLGTTYILKETLLDTIKALPYSLISQSLNLVCALFLVMALAKEDINLATLVSYITIFMISSLAILIPVSIAGAGLRELTFLYGSIFFNVNQELGIAVALLFFIITTLCSLIGIYYWHQLDNIPYSDTRHNRKKR